MSKVRMWFIVECLLDLANVRNRSKADNQLSYSPLPVFHTVR